MNQTLNLRTVVALLADCPVQSLVRGQVGAIAGAIGSRRLSWLKQNGLFLESGYQES